MPLLGRRAASIASCCGYTAFLPRPGPGPLALSTSEQTSGLAACTIGPMTTKLSESKVRSALRELSGWTVLDGKLHREYKFADFIHAFGFMTSGAIVAEAMGHHPEWFNVYNRLTVDLTTHDAGGISAKDFELAGKLNSLYPKAAAPG